MLSISKTDTYLNSHSTQVINKLYKFLCHSDLALIVLWLLAEKNIRNKLLLSIWLCLLCPIIWKIRKNKNIKKICFIAKQVSYLMFWGLFLTTVAFWPLTISQLSSFRAYCQAVKAGEVFVLINKFHLLSLNLNIVKI